MDVSHNPEALHKRGMQVSSIPFIPYPWHVLQQAILVSLYFPVLLSKYPSTGAVKTGQDFPE